MVPEDAGDQQLGPPCGHRSAPPSSSSYDTPTRVNPCGGATPLRLVPIPRRQDPGDGGGGDLPPPDVDTERGHRPDHLVAEGRRLDDELHQVGATPGPHGAVDPPDGAAIARPAAQGGEVVLTDQVTGRLVHQLHIERGAEIDAVVARKGSGVSPSITR